MNKPESLVSPAVLIEPDHEEEPCAKRRKLSAPPITVVSALLSLARPASNPTNKTEEGSQPQAKTLSIPISVRINGQEPRQIKAETVNGNSDSNHVSDDEDENGFRCDGSRRPLSKPCLPRGVLAMPIRCPRAGRTELSCISYNNCPKRKATSILPIILPPGRPLSAAPCLPSVAPGQIVGLDNVQCN